MAGAALAEVDTACALSWGMIQGHVYTMVRTLTLVMVLLVAGCARLDLAGFDLSALFETKPKEPETKLDRLVNQFSATAFDSQYGPRRNSFRRAGPEIVIRIVEPSFGLRPKITATASELAELTKHPITIIELEDRLTPSNVVVTFNRRNICRVDTKGANEPMFVQIGASQCVARELYKALAMDNAACIVDSILCGDGGTAYTETDKLLLHVAFDAKLQARMKRKEALPIVRAIIAELVPEAATEIMADAMAESETE